ncbi:hypothetical protein GCM10010442_66930 [Kitasatospora kifunensis]
MTEPHRPSARPSFKGSTIADRQIRSSIASTRRPEREPSFGERAIQTTDRPRAERRDQVPRYGRVESRFPYESVRPAPTLCLSGAQLHGGIVDEQRYAMPDPDRAEDLAEFVDLLGELRAWAGMPSYRSLAKRVGPLCAPRASCR